MEEREQRFMALWQCYLSGQIDEKAWQEHLDADPELRAWVEQRSPPPSDDPAGEPGSAIR